jgi:hypothetical protein
LWGWPGVTISIDPSTFLRSRRPVSLKGLAGKRVRVRGWIEWRSGPMIAVTHPEQLELLPDAPESGDAKPAPPPQTAPGL